ncbi:MAG: cupredoxin domain-containing protein, partial [Nitrososphaerales archaeon]
MKVFVDKIVVGMAIGLGAIAVVLILMLAQMGIEHTDVNDVPGNNKSDSSDNASSRNNSTTIIISSGIDDLDSGVTFNPPFIRTVLGINNTVTWVNANVTSILLESYEGYFKVTIKPDKSFSFTFNSTGNHEYCETIAGKCGTVIVSTTEMEAKKLVPSAILAMSPEERAKRILAAIDPEDRL